MTIAAARTRVTSGTQSAPYASPAKPDGASLKRAVKAVPQGSRLARGQAQWMRALELHPDLAPLRTDALEHVRAIAWVLAVRASWSNQTSRPTWELLEERTGLSRRTVARWLAWLRERGLLGIVESGTTPQFSPMALSAESGNRAAVYVLAVPEQVIAPQPPTPVEENGTPTGVLSVGNNPHAGARPRDMGPLREPGSTEQPKWGRTAPAQFRRDRLELIKRLQIEASVLRRLTDRRLRHLLRPWLTSSWTVADLLYALDHTPDGQRYTWTTSVRSPAGWLLSRLQPWLLSTGEPRSAPSVELAAAAAQQRAIEAGEKQAAADAATHRQEERAFGERVRAIAGDDYEHLVAVVVTAAFGPFKPKRLVAADALVRGRVRATLCPHCGTGTSSACRTTSVTDTEIREAIDDLLGRQL